MQRIVKHPDGLFKGYAVLFPVEPILFRIPLESHTLMIVRCIYIDKRLHEKNARPYGRASVSFSMGYSYFTETLSLESVRVGALLVSANST